ncbi:protein TIF31, partial [Phenoliferia sp. Uapishka_3]
MSASETTAQPTVDPSVGEVAAVEPESQEAAQEEAPAQFEVTLLLPTQSFVNLSHISPQPRQPNADGFLELPIPVTPTDAVQELRNLITESPEGFWLGAFGFVPVEAEEIVGEEKEGEEKSYGPWVDMTPPVQDPKSTIVDPSMWKLTADGVLGDFCELSAVFGSGEVENKKRGLKVVLTSFSPLATSLHLLRFRDTLFGSLPSQSANASYDPASIGISSGATLYTSVRGAAPAGDVAAPEEEAEVKGKKSKALKKPEAPISAPTEPETESAPKENAKHPFSDWSISDLSPFSYLEHLRPATTPALASPCIKALGISAWSPPPHPRRMRGDIVYLTLTTLEGESYQVTAAATGFWIAKSTPTTFDPTARTPTPRGLRPTPYHSLFELSCALSPSFSKALVKIIETQNPAPQVSTDIYATLAISHAIPASSWLVPAPVHVSDPFRTQLAYLLTTSTNADLLPPARDWNDEFCQYRDLPQGTMSERLLRERLLHRVQCDFVQAGTRGAVSIARGDVPPLNPNEPVEAHTFIHNNMLFTRADDAIKAFAHLGGNDAARVAASKDLQGVNVLEQLDIKGLSTMASVVVDYLGERWVAQSLIPGLFKTTEEDKEAKEAESKPAVVYPEGDEAAAAAALKAAEEDKAFPSMETPNRDDYPSSGAFRIVYGSGNPEEPDEKIRSSAYFAALAKSVAEKVNFAEHKVIASDGKVTELWTSTDMHGIAAPDGRSYFIDCFRLHCTDIEFLENNVSGATFTDASDKTVNGVHTPPAYPHRLALLRPELLEAYRDSKLEKWIEVRVKEHRAQLEEQEKAAASVESELKEAATDSTSPAEKAKAEPAIIQASEFKLAFNPDAFVERKPLEDGKAAVLIYDPEEESTKAVRDASVYLREKVLPEFIVMVISAVVAITDGQFLAKLLHRRGINIRYLGMLADIAERQGPTLEYPRGTSKPDIEFGLASLKSTLQHAMVVRACKHILNRLLRKSLTADHASLIAHFFNCLVGTSLEPNPSPELVGLPAGANAQRAWASLTPSTLRSQIVEEVEARYRYTIPTSFFNPVTLVPTRLVREICMRVGIQLVLREYKFGSRVAVEANGNGAGSSSEEEKIQASPSPVVNELKKKKKKSPAQLEREAAKADENRTVTFRAEDVLNVMPVIKASVHKSQLAEETFAAGTAALDKGSFELGQEMVQDALNFYEQVFGSVHQEAASRFHTLGIMYHNLAQGALRRVQTHETAEDQLKSMTPEARVEGAKRLQEYLLENPDAQRAEADNFLQSAVRMLRQSVIIAERTFGLDSPEAIQHYSDLGLLEQAVGNSDTGMRLTKHALSLWASAYGPDHPSSLNLLSNVASMVQTQYGVVASIPLLIECWKLAKVIYGDSSLQAASLEYQMAQVYGLTGKFAESIAHGTAALTLFRTLYDPETKELQEAEQFLAVVTDAAGREDREAAERAERLQKKFPKLMADKDIRARIGAASTHSHRTPASASAPSPAPVEDVPVVVKKDYGQKANLSVDELVSFIQGTPVASSSKAARKQRKN